MLKAFIYDLSKKDSKCKEITFPVKSAEGKLAKNVDKEIRNMLNAEENDEIFIDSFTLDSKVDLALEDMDSRDGLYRRNLNKVQKLGSIILENQIDSLMDLYNEYIASCDNSELGILKIIEYNDDEDLNSAFSNQTPYEVLRNAGDINFNDDFITVTPDTNEVNTLSAESLNDYLKDNATDMLNKLAIYAEA